MPDTLYVGIYEAPTCVIVLKMALIAASMFGLVFRRRRSTIIRRRGLSFENFNLDELLIKRLQNVGIVSPTDIQEKSLDAVLKGKNVMINAETGSGKTLCYLLPIVNQLLKSSKGTSRFPSALILLPNVELCYQVAEVFKILADPHMFPCIVHRDSRLCVSNIYPIVVATPNALLNYNLNILGSIKTVVTDEADLMVTSGGKDVWTILNFFNESVNNINKIRWNKDRKKRFPNNRLTDRQFIFAAATLPSRGRKAASNVLQGWLPDSELIATDAVHNTVPTAKMHYVKVAQHTKLRQLLKTLNIIAGIQEEEDSFSSKFERVRHEEIKVLVFANTVSAVDKAFKFLTTSDTKPELLSSQSVAVIRASNRIKEQHLLHNSRQMVRSENETNRRLFWRPTCSRLHKNIPLQERLDILSRFRSGEVKVLVCTDMASRGLDIRDVSHVIQLDFAPNSATVLHRAGRTARAGAVGSVISFVTDEDEDLARVLRSRQTELEGYQQTFSRNRMFRRRVKSNTLPMAEPLGLAK